MGAPRVSVVIPSLSSVSRRALASLDQQTLGPDEFEVLVGHEDEHDAESGRLADLVAHRTNLRPFDTSPGTSLVARCRAGLSAATAEYALLLHGDRGLSAHALAELCTLAEKTGADVCIGLTGRVGRRPLHGPIAGSDDHADLSPEHPLREDVHGRIVRRELLSGTAGTDNQTPERWAALATESAARVAAVANCAIFVDGQRRRARAGAARTRTTATVAATNCEWRDGVLIVDVRLREATGGEAGRVAASLFSEGSGIEWSVQTPDVDELPDGVTRIRFDPEGVARGGLPDGIWWPTVRVDLGAGFVVADVQLGSGTAPGASYVRRPIVAFARQGRLGIDVGGVRHQLVRRIPARGARVLEDARGSLLTATIPDVEVAEGLRLEGTLRLGKGMPVKAWLEREGSAARLTAWVSGLPGSAPLFTRFTPAAYAPARARLVVGPAGDMHVRRLRRPRTRPAPTRPSATSGAKGTPRQAVRTAARLGQRAARRARSRLGIS